MLLLMIKFLQANLNRVWRARDFMIQFVRESEAHIALISEPNLPNSSGWFFSRNRLAALYIGDPAWRGISLLPTRQLRGCDLQKRLCGFLLRFAEYGPQKF